MLIIKLKLKLRAKMPGKPLRKEAFTHTVIKEVARSLLVSCRRSYSNCKRQCIM